MQKLGIKQGDIVKVSGKTKSTAAIYYPMTLLDLQKTETPEMKVEFLNNPEKKVQPLPKIILNGPVSCNVDPSREWQRTVILSRFPESKVKSENIPEADTVTFATMDMAEKIMPRYQSNLDYSEILGFIITKDDRIDIPFQKEWLEKKQQEMQRKESQDKSSEINSRRRNRTRPPESYFPSSFQSAIINASPEGEPFWRITENTKFEFENAGFEKIFNPYKFTPKKLVNVISISKQLFVKDTEFTVPSLEVYSNMMRLIWYSHQRIKIPESDFTDLHKMNKMHRMRHHDHPRLVVTLKDDLGNHYDSVNENGGGGGSHGPDPSTREIVSDFSWNHIFSPTLDKNAKELIVTIKEVQWITQDRKIPDIPPTEPPNMTPIENQPIPKLVIAEGPWTFKIPINKPN